MLRSNAWIIVCALGAAAVAGCVLGDLVESAGTTDVRFEWSGPTMMRSGEPTPIRVSLFIQGLPATTPPVQVSIPDTTVIRFRTNRDTIIGCRSGMGRVEARISSSLSPNVDTSFTVQVTGGPAPCP